MSDLVETFRFGLVGAARSSASSLHPRGMDCVNPLKWPGIKREEKCDRSRRLNGDRVFVFGRVKARWREKKARKHVSNVENFPITVRRRHLNGMFGV